MAGAEAAAAASGLLLAACGVSIQRSQLTAELWEWLNPNARSAWMVACVCMYIQTGFGSVQYI